MNKLALAAGCLLLALAPAAHGEAAAFTNKDVLALVEAGLPASVIVAKIETSRTDFDTSTGQLVELSQAGVHASVLEAMIQGGTTEMLPVKTTFRDCPQCPELVVLPAGTFMMGSSTYEDSRPHQATIDKPFAVGKYEITRLEFGRFVVATGYSMESSCWIDTPHWREWGWAIHTRRHWRNPGFDQGARDPVVCVNWDDAKAYTEWLSDMTGKLYRLLSESEWEYAARAGTTTSFHFGGTISTDQANYNGNYPYGSGPKGIYRERTVAVGSFPANDFGLHDMHGNVLEWVEDCWHDSYVKAPSDGKPWTKNSDCDYRVLRGGSWDDSPNTSAYRDWDGIASGNRNRTRSRTYTVGFRVARALTP